MFSLPSTPLLNKLFLMFDFETVRTCTTGTNLITPRLGCSSTVLQCPLQKLVKVSCLSLCPELTSPPTFYCVPLEGFSTLKYFKQCELSILYSFTSTKATIKAGLYLFECDRLTLHICKESKNTWIKSPYLLEQEQMLLRSLLTKGLLKC